MANNSNWRMWLMAARPKTLTASLIPVMVSTALVKTYEIDWMIAALAFLFALFVQIGTNLFNDAIDFKKKTDTNERIGFTRVTQAGIFTAQQVMLAGFLCFTLALLAATPLVYLGGMPIALLMVASLLAGYCYTGGPYPLSYLGIADLFVFVFYGLVAVMALYYLQTGHLSTSSLLAACQIGALATVISALNNLRDCYQDVKSNKKTIPVRFGVQAGRAEIITLLLIPYLLSFFWIGQNQALAGVLPWITLPIAIYLISVVSKTEPSPIYNRFFGTAAFLHLSFGILLTIGLLF